MPTIDTARGPVGTADLGPTLMHEHIAIRTPGIAENWPQLWDRDACTRTAEVRLADLAQRGIRTLVDLTTADLGRDIAYLREVQARTAVNIVLCTGIYWIVPRYWWGREIDDLVRVFVQDIREGIAGTAVKAGIIKLATDRDGITPVNEKCLRAGARAHRETGVPISTHTGPPTMGREQQRVFQEEGVDLSRVVIGHVGDTTDTAYLKELMDRGSTIGMDRFGLERHATFDERVATVAALCADGYADRMVLSHDASCCLDWIPDRAAADAALPNWRYTHISDDVLPALKRRGVTDAHIHAMLVQNPRRLFEAAGPY